MCVEMNVRIKSERKKEVNSKNNKLSLIRGSSKVLGAVNVSTYQLLLPEVLTSEHHSFHNQHTRYTCKGNQHQQNLDPHLRIQTQRG